MAPDLTTTSYAILGLLSLRSWTSYELAEQMKRALGQFWPRAESGIYREPKKLEVHGLARSTTEHVGERPRTRYTITAQGRRALADWVPTPGEGPVVEFEQLVKVFFAEHGTKADLLATLTGVREWVEDQAVATSGIPHEYLEGRGGYPERLPWLILAGKFLDDIQQAVDRWAAWAIAVVEAWPDDLSKGEPDREALELMAEHDDELVDRARARARSVELVVVGVDPPGPSPVGRDRPRRQREDAALGVLEVRVLHRPVRPHHLRDLVLVAPAVLVVDLGARLHGPVPAGEQQAQRLHDVVDLALGLEEETAAVREVRARPVEAEQVREVRDRDAEVGRRLDPPLLRAATRRPVRRCASARGSRCGGSRSRSR